MGYDDGRVIILGPFRFAWDDADVDANPGAVLLDGDEPAVVPAGSIVLTAFIVVATPFDSSAVGKIRISPVGGASNDWEDLMTGGDDLNTFYVPTRPDAFYVPGVVDWSGMRVLLDANLYAGVSGATLTAGEADAYVLVASLT